MTAPPASRNDPCPCGSGIRYKHCHGRVDGIPAAASGTSTDEAKRRDHAAAESTVSPIAAARSALAAGRTELAIDQCERLLALDPTDCGALRVLGEACVAVDLDRAEACWKRVLEQVPRDPEAAFHLGNIARARGRQDDAIAWLEVARAGAPGHGGVLNNLGLALEAAGRIDAAEPMFRQAMTIAPEALEPLANLAQNLYQQKRFADALPLFDALVARFAVEQAAIWANRGVCLSQVGRLAAAEESFRKALAQAPDTASLQRDLGLNCIRLQHYEDAAHALERGVALDPNDVLARSMLLCAELNTARWERFGDAAHALVDAAEGIADRPDQSLSAFDFAVICDDPRLQRNAARSWTRGQAQRPHAGTPPALRAPGPLRLGFVSTAFYNHPVGRLIVGLLERLDRSRFNVVVYAVESAVNDEVSRRIEAAAGAYRSTASLDPNAIAASIRDDRIDVLFDLNGFTGTQMIPIFALRPAPVQVNFLGYTGTLGMTCYDWIVADHYCIPATERLHYDERPVYVDPCYLPSDTRRAVDAAGMCRADYGLPEEGLVFCAHAAVYKILPPVFAQWMALLARHPGSVLWLRAAPGGTGSRLRHAAAAQGIDGARLVLAPPDALPRYLARFRLADLFLDTYPFGAHTTVNDALFAGLPVVTLAGRSFAARASASQLVAAGLDDLIARDLHDYLAIADRMAADPARRAAIAASLRAATARAPLFDMDRYARTFEAALTSAWAEAAFTQPAVDREAG